MEALGFILTMIAQVVSYYSSTLLKQKREAQSMCEAIKKHFHYNSLKEIYEMDHILERMQSLFSVKDLYRILFDVLISDDLY